jgi:RNA recognition motif-containing protein
MNIFVGNLSFDAVEADIKKLFEGFGNVASVVIVRRKEKKTPKSRGFGFVEMPDEQQALAAIAALNGKEFMGRILNVDRARPKGQKAMVWPPIAKAKKETQAASELNPVRNTESIREKNKISNGVKEKRQPKPGAYRGGRRTHSYMKQRGLAGIQEEAKPRQRSQDNPMRWRKRQDQPKPWQRSSDEHKSWKKTEEGARPWSKSSGESKPWRKSEGGFKPWKKTEGESRPWKKSTRESKPWKKPSAGPKSWSKSSERPQKSGFNGRKKPGGYKR